MELRHLRYFQTVAQELNVTRAAEKLHMAQPPLSRQIRQFEEEVGVALFDRVGRGLRLTEAGRFLLEQSLQLTQRLEETLESTRRIGRNEKRWFGIGFVPSVLYGVLPELIRELRGDDSQVEVGLTEMITVQQLEALKSGRIDLAFGRLTFNDPAIVQQVVMAESLVAAIPGTAPTPNALRRRRAGPTAADPLSGPATAKLRRSCAVAVPRPRVAAPRGAGGQRTADRARPRRRRARYHACAVLGAAPAS
jgi:DNA-binding transcriptional LysR family regulator